MRNVFEAAQDRIKWIFDSFDYVYVSFSGGKDSGVLLNMCIDYLKKNKHVASYRIGGEGEGGTGATVVTLKTKGK